MEDIFKPRGATKASQPDAGGAVVRTTPILGIVKDNIDPTRQGRIRVYISDLGTEDSNDSSGWITVGYMMPFFGQTLATGATDNFGTYSSNPISYGVWSSPPDIGSVVVCIFINGDINYGYYIGCIPKAETLYMVPAIGGNENVVLNTGEAKSFGGAKKLPVGNLNTNNDGLIEKADFLEQPRPVHSYIASTFAQQGLIRDPIRGPIGSSAQRESPSRVGFGISTPGRPIYEGGFTDENIKTYLGRFNQDTNLKIVSRRAGHTFVMDDGDILGEDQLIRLRTSLGHQILMSDNGQCLSIIHANGQTYIELGKEGTVDVFATNSVNIRTQGDLNLHADRNININAAKTFNISAENININTDKDLSTRVGGNHFTYTMGKYTLKVDGPMSLFSEGESSFASSSVTYINGSKVNLNTGSSSIVPSKVEQVPIIAHSDTLNDNEKGWLAAPGKLLSIVSRAPAHMPWSEAGQGVDIKTSGNASDELPSNPSTQVNNINNNTLVSNISVPAVNSAIISTVPQVAQVSAAIDKNTTAALIGQTATLAATGLAKDAVKNGSGVVNVGDSKIASLGLLGQTPNILESTGVLKPGSSLLINSMINSGKTLEQALTPNLFTGKAGAENLSTFVNSVQAQVNVATDTLKQAQSQLISTGLITGKESGTQISGLVMATANSGLNKTLELASVLTPGITNNGTLPNVGSLVQGEPSPLLGNPASLIAAGNVAGNVASTVTGALNSIASAIGNRGISGSTGLGGLVNAAKGLAAAAFSAVVNGLPTLQANVPQNLRTITNNATQALGNTTQGPSGVASLASGLISIPGSAKVVGHVISNSVNAVNSVPGITTITNLVGNLNPTTIDQLKSGVTSLPKIAAANLPQTLTNQLNSAISALSSGGSIPIKLASIATDTYNRDTIKGQMSIVLNNPKIPLPNYAGNSATFNNEPTTEQLQKLVSKNNELSALYNEIVTQQNLTDSLRLAYDTAKDTLPQGDLRIAQARNAWIAELDKLKALAEKVYNLNTTEIIV